MEDRPGRARGPLQGVSSLRALCGGPRRGKLYPGSSVGGSASGLWVPSPETPALHPRGGRLSQPSPGDGGPLARRPQVSRPPTAQPPRFTPIHSSSADPRTGSKTNSTRNPAHVAELRSRAGFGAGAGAPGAWLGVSGRGGRREPPVAAADEQEAASSPRSRAASAYPVTVEATPAREPGGCPRPPTFPLPPTPSRPRSLPSSRASPRPAPGSARGRRWAPGLARSPGLTHSRARTPGAALRAGPRSPRPCRRTERRKMADDSTGPRGCGPAAAAAGAAAAAAAAAAARSPLRPAARPGCGRGGGAPRLVRPPGPCALVSGAWGAGGWLGDAGLGRGLPAAGAFPSVSPAASAAQVSWGRSRPPGSGPSAARGGGTLQAGGRLRRRPAAGG